MRRPHIGDMPVFGSELALLYLGGRSALLADTLLRFADEYAASGALASLRARTDRVQAFHDVHTLKGAAGMLGLGAVQNAATELEQILFSEGGPWPDASALDAALAESLAAMPGLARQLRDRQ